MGAEEFTASTDRLVRFREYWPTSIAAEVFAGEPLSERSRAVLANLDDVLRES